MSTRPDEGARPGGGGVIVTVFDERLKDCKRLFLESQTWDKNGLGLVLSRIRDNVTSEYLLTFPHPIPAFRMIGESYRVAEWVERENFPGVGAIVPSPWFEELSGREPLLMHHFPDVVHYVVNTQDECFDILAAGGPPIVTETASR